MLAEAVFVVSAWLRTVTECAPPVAGGVYLPFASIVPTLELPPGTVSTSQVTLVLLLPVTVELNCCVCEVVTAAFFGATATEKVGGGGGE